MFMMQTPKTFKIGETIDCNINGKPERLTWKSAGILVIEPDDEREIITTRIDGEMRVFTCGHEGVAASRYAVKAEPGGVVVSAPLDLDLGDFSFDEAESQDESNEEPQEDDPEPEYETSMLFVNPMTREVLPIKAIGYKGIKAKFGKGAGIEANIHCEFQGDIIITTWGDCEEAITAPGWYTTLNPAQPLHGFAIFDAADVNTGHAVDCPITAADLLPRIVWEDYAKRINSEKPNKEWIMRFGKVWGVSGGPKWYYTGETEL